MGTRGKNGMSGSPRKFSSTLLRSAYLLLLLSLIPVPAGFCSPSPVTGWPKTFPGYYVFSTEFADLDKDGQKEIIVGLTPSVFGLNKPVPEYTHVEAYKADGRLLWASDSLKPYVSSPGSAFAVGEVDTDGYPEIVLGVQAPPLGGSHSAIFVLDHNGKIKQGWPVLFAPFPIGQPLLADLDGDEACEIIFSHPDSASKEEAISAYQGDGTLLWTRPNPPYQRIRGLAVGDLSGGGRSQEVVVSYRADDPPQPEPRFDSEILILNADGSDSGTDILIPVSKDLVSSPRLSAPVLGDLDGDGELEIIICSAETHGGMIQVHAFHPDGTAVEGFPKEAGTFSTVLPSPVLADINGDKKLEIFAFTETAIYGWNYMGDALRGWPVMLKWELQNPRFLAITNIDSSKEMEILFTSHDSVLEALNANGSGTAKYPMRLDSTGITTYQTTFGELAADHDLYMGASTTNSQYTNGKAFLVKMNVPYNPKRIDWPMAGHDLRLTGRVGIFTNPPIFSPAIPGNQPIKSGALFTYVVQAKDLDGDALTYAVEGRLPVGASFNAASHTFRWTPQAKQDGAYFLTFSVSDGVTTTRGGTRIVVSTDKAAAPEVNQASKSSAPVKVSTNFTFATPQPKVDAVAADVAVVPPQFSAPAEDVSVNNIAVASPQPAPKAADKPLASVAGASPVSAPNAAEKALVSVAGASPVSAPKAVDKALVSVAATSPQPKVDTSVMVASPKFSTSKVIAAAPKTGQDIEASSDSSGRVLVATRVLSGPKDSDASEAIALSNPEQLTLQKAKDMEETKDKGEASQLIKGAVSR